MQAKFDIRKIDPQGYPFESRWFDYHGGQIHYIDEGSGEAVVMLHGNPTWSYLYRHVIKQLSGRVRCIAIDYPGFGLSSLLDKYGYTAPEHARAVMALLNYIGLKRYTLLLQDWGGPIGLYVATQQPQKVAGLVLCNTWCWHGSLGMKLFSWLMGGPLGRYFIRQHNLFAKAFMKSALEFEDKQPQHILDAFTAPFPTPQSRIGTWVFPKEINQSSQWINDTANNFYNLRDLPVEFVWGMKDPAFKHKVILDTWKQYFPMGNWTQIANASHYLQETAYREIADAVLRITEMEANVLDRENEL